MKNFLDSKKTQNEQGEFSTLPYVCDICDKRVSSATKQDGDGIGTIWVCSLCNIKYPPLSAQK